MADPNAALATQIANIQKKTGKSLAELEKIVKGCGFSKHGEIRDYLKNELGLGHGYANTLVHVVMKSDGASAAEASGGDLDALVAGFYAGPKAALRPIHDAVMKRLAAFGEFEIAPKKTYVSLRRKKQFAMVGPATNTRVEVGINAKDLKPTARLEAEKPKSMCDFKVKLTSADQVDDELIGWIKKAYDSAG